MPKYMHTSDEVYFVDRKGERLSMYKNKCRVFFKGQIYDDVVMTYGGQILLTVGNEKYILNDGFRDELIKAGYVVLNDYDRRKFDGSPKDGDALNKRILVQMQDCLAMYNQPDNDNPLESWIESPYYHYTIKVDSVEDIVKYNHIRKDNDLTYYPFDRSMDKYGTVYMSVFAVKRVSGEADENKYGYADKLINDILKDLGPEYHFISCPIKGTVIHWDNI